MAQPNARLGQFIVSTFGLAVPGKKQDIQASNGEDDCAGVNWVSPPPELEVCIQKRFMAYSAEEDATNRSQIGW
ncbi:Uu.00g017370.m01.CDS01 [Anthostomella pinea]|uniref:Uu.00g017370.m01.CDS01 n=1 Tax=Anthostomella pinea TaxID=933095 RepID=A0AAI8W040_9PEZI|nr:Uu.00g017370.m01.CDS01 [Anthostomella pinea]